MKSVILTVLFLLAAASAFAQTKPPQAAEPPSAAPRMPTFRADTELVTVPVVATKGGKRAAGLKKEDFTVLEDGQPKPVAFFEEVTVQPHLLKAAEVPPGSYSNRIGSDEQPNTLTVIVLDVINTPYLEQTNSRRQILDFLVHSAKRSEPTMLATLNRQGLRIIHDFTTSPAVLVAALRQTKSSLEGTSMSREETGAVEEMKGKYDIANQVDVTTEASDLATFVNGTNDLMQSAMTMDQERKAELTLMAINQLVRAIGAVPGRKAMLWTSGGFVCDPGVSMGGLHYQLMDKCNATWRLLSANNVAVYPINPVQPTNPGFVSPGYGTAVRNAPRGLGLELVAESFARYTGGKVCTFRNDDSCYREAVDDSLHYYILSYYATPTAKPTWKKLAVRVKAPGVSLRARTGYMSAGLVAEADDQRKNDVAMAIISPIDYTGVPMTVKWLEAAAQNGRRRLRFQILVEPSGLTIDENDHNHLKLDVIAYATNPKGEHVGDVTRDINAHLQDRNLAALRKQGFSYTDILDVPDGEVAVRFIVRDDLSGRMGTVTAPTPKLVAPGN